MNTLSLDTEFKNSNEPHVLPVCAVVRILDQYIRYWFPDDREKFVSDFRMCMTKGLGIISYYCSAEARFLSAVGFTNDEILSWTWLDPYVLWRMLTFSHPAYRYGPMYVTNQKTGESEWRVTIPPPVNAVGVRDTWTEDDEGGLHKIAGDPRYRPVGFGLTDVLQARLRITGDPVTKTRMRDMILCNATFSDSEKAAIMEYCRTDVQYLRDIFTDLYQSVHRLTKGKVGLPEIKNMSGYVAACGLMENNGIPVTSARLVRLGENYSQLDADLIAHCNSVHPFYVIKKTGEWKESYDQWASYLNACQYDRWWPRTPTGKFKKDREILKEYSGDPVIEAFRITKYARSQIKYFRPDAVSKILSNIGSDSRLRVLLSPFGSKTGRNQPGPSHGWIYGMSTWLRPLIEPALGEIIIGADYSAEEIALQGHVSNDENLLAAYTSGDPYTWFAQFVGDMTPGTARVEKDGKKIFVGVDMLPCPPETQTNYRGIRNTYKALVLGIGYGMGLEKLAGSLTATRLAALAPELQEWVRAARVSTDLEVVQRAETLLNDLRVVAGITAYERSQPRINQAGTYRDYHYTAFAEYWRWHKNTQRQYIDEGFLTLPDGWSLFEGEHRLTTVTNFPVQGLGTTLLRLAVRKCFMAGLKVFAPLHDCIYISSTPATEARDCGMLQQCMREAVIDICGSDLIRIDVKTHHTDWSNYESTWTEEKQSAEFKKFGKYMAL